MPKRWEHGSEFHWPPVLSGERNALPSDVCRLGSGRDAMRLLVNHGVEHLGWRRFWLPAFLCQEVVAAAVGTGIECCLYRDAPTVQDLNLDIRDMGRGDVVLWVNYFGLRAGFDCGELQDREVTVVEDHTHALWSSCAGESRADFAIASLRKMLPVPDGGLLWSPCGHRLPEEPAVTEDRDWGAHRKFSAMVFKGMYLDGRSVRKQAFRAMAIEGERYIASGEVSGMSAISTESLPLFPTSRWREQRANNFEVAQAALDGVPWVEVLKPQGSGCVPFSLVLVFDSALRRERVRTRLIDRDIFPAVLWPLDEAVLAGVPDEYVMLSRRMLSIHCDYRYSEQDMLRVAQTLLDVGSGE